MAAVRVGNWASNKWGFINLKGELIIPPIFEKAFAFSDGLAKVVLNKEWWFIDKNGTKVIPLSKYTESTSFHDGFCTVHKYEKFYSDRTSGVIDKTGTEVIPCNLTGLFLHCSDLAYRVKCYKINGHL
jgi:hypothetical protein